MSQELPNGVELPELPKLLISENATLTIGPFTDDQMHEYATAAILADREKQAARVPEGYKLVPLEPTPEMVTAGRRAIRNGGLGVLTETWDAMLAAAPTTEPSKAEQADAPKVDFEDPRVQTVYRILCSDDHPEGDEHWEGFAARRIVDALATQPPASNAGEREAFEAKERSKYKYPNDGLTRYPDAPDQYVLPLMQARWEGWQARAALATKPQAGDVAQDKIDAERWRYVEENGFPDCLRQIHPTFERPHWGYADKGPRFPSPAEAVDAAIRAARTRGEGSGA